MFQSNALHFVKEFSAFQKNESTRRYGEPRRGMSAYALFCPYGNLDRLQNKPKSFVDEGTWACLHFHAIQSIVRHASESSPKEFHKFLSTASLLNKHWKSAIDDIVRKLDVKKNRQQGLESLLKRFSRVTTLRLTSIDSEALSQLQDHEQVEDLELYAVDFSSHKTVKGLARLRFLRGIKFRNSPSLDDRTLKAVACCSNLTHLDLTGCSLITGDGVKILGQLTNLVHLYLGDCAALSTEGLQSLSSLSRLECLNLSGVQSVDNSVMHALSALPRLTDLDVFMCPNVTDIGLWYLAKKVYLKNLNLFSCDRITDEGLKAIAQQTALRKLNLGWCCLITDYGIRLLSELEHLCELRMSYVPITFDGLVHLSRLSSLTLLDARGCENSVTELGNGIHRLVSAYPAGQLTVLC